jgi:GNAT superfamily N-acetyltransferase
MDDLESLIAIEHLCFSAEEAGTREAFEMRIQRIPDSFFAAEKDGKILGLVNGPVIPKPFITDDLFAQINPNPLKGGHQSILGLAVSPHAQKQGVATALLAHLEYEARRNERETITLTCKEDLIPFYKKHGYVNRGVSNSEHGGVIWYNMTKDLC